MNENTLSCSGAAINLWISVIFRLSSNTSIYWCTATNIDIIIIINMFYIICLTIFWLTNQSNALECSYISRIYLHSLVNVENDWLNKPNSHILLVFFNLLLQYLHIWEDMLMVLTSWSRTEDKILVTMLRCILPRLCLANSSSWPWSSWTLWSSTFHPCPCQTSWSKRWLALVWG